MEHGKELHYRYNIFYPILILLLSIIVLLTVKWGTIPDLAKLISFGLTLTSLFLALIAIVFAIFSNFSFTKSSSNLQDASNQISQTTEILRKATHGIEEKISNIPHLIEGIKVSVTETQERILERLSTQEAIPKETIEVADIQKDRIKSFLNFSSYVGLLGLYACQLSEESGFPINFKKIRKFELLKDYIYGYLVASSSFGILDFKRKEEDIFVKKLHDGVKENILQRIKETMNGLVKGNPEVFKIEIFNKELKEIENYFKSED